MAGQINYKTEGQYHLHKRNALFLAAAIIVIWFAHPGATIQIPGLGTKAQIRTPIAFTLMTIAALYTMVQFIVDWLAVRAVNSSGIVRTAKADINEAIATIIGELQGTAAGLQQAILIRVNYGDPLQRIHNQLREVVSMKEGTDSLILGLQSPNRGAPITIDDFNANYRILNSAVEGIGSEVAQFIKQQNDDSKLTTDGMEKAVAAFEATKTNLTRLSDMISLTQSVNFHTDRYLVIGSGVCAVSVTICSYLGRVPPF